MKKQKRSSWAIPYENRKISYNYKILKTWEAGVILSSDQVKSLIAGNFDLIYAKIIFNPKIDTFELEGAKIGGTKLSQKLLLNRKEIIRIHFEKKKEKALLLAKSLYFKNNKIKIEVVLVKRKKGNDKAKLSKKKSKFSFGLID